MFFIIILGLSVCATAQDTTNQNRNTHTRVFDSVPGARQVQIESILNSIMNQGNYLAKAGNNFTTAGVLLSLSIVSGVVTAFIPTGSNSNSSTVYIMAAVSGGFFLSSVVFFFIGSHNLKLAGDYHLSLDGNSLKFYF